MSYILSRKGETLQTQSLQTISAAAEKTSITPHFKDFKAIVFSFIYKIYTNFIEISIKRFLGFMFFFFLGSGLDSYIGHSAYLQAGEEEVIPQILPTDIIEKQKYQELPDKKEESLYVSENTQKEEKILEENKSKSLSALENPGVCVKLLGASVITAKVLIMGNPYLVVPCAVGWTIVGICLLQKDYSLFNKGILVIYVSGFLCTAGFDKNFGKDKDVTRSIGVQTEPLCEQINNEKNNMSSACFTCRESLSKQIQTYITIKWPGREYVVMATQTLQELYEPASEIVELVEQEILIEKNIADLYTKIETEVHTEHTQIVPAAQKEQTEITPFAQQISCSAVQQNTIIQTPGETSTIAAAAEQAQKAEQESLVQISPETLKKQIGKIVKHVAVTGLSFLANIPELPHLEESIIFPEAHMLNSFTMQSAAQENMERAESESSSVNTDIEADA